MRKGVSAAVSVLLVTVLAGVAHAQSGADYGPPNLIKTMKTPFTAGSSQDGDNQSSAADGGELGSISLTPGPSKLSQLRSRSSLSDRLIPNRLFLPERMVLGQATKFTIKGRPGSKVAIAMADRPNGAKPIQGHDIRLGPDRKVVAVGHISNSGVVELYIETPIEGDLIGQQLFFEAALWSKDDMSDVEFCQMVSPANTTEQTNGVIVAQQALEKKRGVRIVPDSAMPLMLRQGTPSLSSGQP